MSLVFLATSLFTHPVCIQRHQYKYFFLVSLSVLIERRQKFLQHFSKLQQNGRVMARSAWNFFNQSRLDRGVCWSSALYETVTLPVRECWHK